MKFDALFDLAGKTAIVTGGANGIGKAAAMLLAKAGANIAIADFKPEDAETAAREIRELGVKAIAVRCNVLKDEDLVNLVETTVAELGSIHILISNAGGGGGNSENPFKISVEEFMRVFNLNVFSAWRLCQLCVPHMKKAGYGSIVIKIGRAHV